MTLKTAIIGRVGFHKKLQDSGARLTGTDIIKTPFGASNPLHTMAFNGSEFVSYSRHGEERYEVSAPFVNDRANLYSLKMIGINRIISISAPGSLDKVISPGSIVIPDDILDRTHYEHRTFFENRGLGVIRMNSPFCPHLQNFLYKEVQKKYEGDVIQGGVYAATAGPRMETRAEIRELSQLGCSLVGMTLVPEIFLARELEICYSAICYSVNFAEGIYDKPYKEGVLFEGLASDDEFNKVSELENTLPGLILGVFKEVDALEYDCQCKAALKRYKLRGDIPEDFKDWF